MILCRRRLRVGTFVMVRRMRCPKEPWGRRLIHWGSNSRLGWTERPKWPCYGSWTQQEVCVILSTTIWFSYRLLLLAGKTRLRRMKRMWLCLCERGSDTPLQRKAHARSQSWSFHFPMNLQIPSLFDWREMERCDCSWPKFPHFLRLAPHKSFLLWLRGRGDEEAARSPLVSCCCRDGTASWVCRKTSASCRVGSFGRPNAESAFRYQAHLLLLLISQFGNTSAWLSWSLATVCSWSPLDC